MKNSSIWLDKVEFKKHESLNKNINVDVLIIGGGLTGLSTAYHLRNSDLKICLVDEGLIAHGVSSRTTGKLTYLQDNIYSKLNDLDKALKYYESQKEIIEEVVNIIKTNNIDCNLKKVKSYLYTDQNREKDKIKTETSILKKLNIDYEVGNLDIDKCKYAISVDDTYVFHPIKYLLGLADIIEKSGINIYENSSVTDIKKESNLYHVTVNGNTVVTKTVVVASHYPFFLNPFFLPLKTYLEKSYISASRISNISEFSAITVSQPIKSMRYHSDLNNYFIYLNGTHNLCTKYNDKDNFNDLLLDLRHYSLKPDYIWSNHDVMTEDYLPYIGYLDDNLLIGCGYNTWGMTNGSLAGVIISDLILKNENKYSLLFDPKRSKNLSSLKYPLYMCYSAKSFIENKIIKNKFWYNDNVKFEKRNGKNVAIYTDEDKEEHIVYNKCPHLKCSLILNEVEKTWDCPCHGSRFDIDGRSISGPSNCDISFKE